MPEFFGFDGQPISEDEWRMLFSDFEGRCARRDDLERSVFISTVWIGMDPGYIRVQFFEGLPDIRPRIWETAVFTPAGGWEIYRFPSKDDALAFHEDQFRAHGLLENPTLVEHED